MKGSLFILLLSSALLILCPRQVAAQEDDSWTAVTRDVEIPFDLEATPLQIKTDSEAGSDAVVSSYFLMNYTSDYTADSTSTYTPIHLYFFSRPRYKIAGCIDYQREFAVARADALPLERNKIWTISKSSTALRITCNDVVVVNIQFYDFPKSCTDRWSTDNSDVRGVKFRVGDDASRFFRAKPAETATARCSKPTIENGSVRPESATIEAGQFYTALCDQGYTMDGYRLIECYEDGTLSNTPVCLGWVAVRRDRRIAYDLKESPLQVLSLDNMDYNANINLYLYTADDSSSYFGSITVDFDNHHDYYQVTIRLKPHDEPCYYIYHGALTADAVGDSASIWTFHKTHTGIRVSYNGLVVVDLQFHDIYIAKSYEHSSCLNTWREDVIDYIWFSRDGDHASDMYRRKPPAETATAKCSKPTIENGSVRPESATIEAGQFYTALCGQGYTMDGYRLIECYEDGTLSTITICTDWTTIVRRDEFIPYDLEASPLQIMTYSSMRKNVISLDTYTADLEYINTIQIVFYNVTTLRYIAGDECGVGCSVGCGWFSTVSPVLAKELPPETLKIWTISKNSTAIRITCNDVEVANVEFGGDWYRSRPSCGEGWSREVAMISFSASHDTASRFIRAEPADNLAGTCEKPTIENGNVSPANGSIGVGQLYYVSCSYGYAVEGTPRIDCLGNGILSTLPTCPDNWSRVSKGKKITHDFGESLLQVMTDSITGSNDKVYIRFFAHPNIGYLQLKFSDTPQYKIRYCTGGYADFAAELPAQRNKIWTIRQSATTLRVTCNDVEVVNIRFYDHECAGKWSGIARKIEFHSNDRASDFYREKPSVD